MGPITDEVVVAIAALILVAVSLHYHIKGAFCVGLFFGTFTWWIIEDEWPRVSSEYNRLYKCSNNISILSK
jgi:hypothetical protein